MKFDNSYYEDEVREGFYIPGMIKRSWASQLEILEKVGEVCEKYGIRWFADCGTLIGAVRHHGFIPWDDDLDICMLKEDYDKFLAVADMELPEDYKILNIYREKEYRNFLTRIVNHDVIDMSGNFLEKNHGFPYTSGIDIFPLHNLYNDEERENTRQNKANRVWTLFEEFGKRAGASLGEISDLLDQAEIISGISADRNVPFDNALYKIMDSLYSKTDDEETENVALIPFWIREKNHKFPKFLFDYSIYMPFENGSIPVPAGYEELLRLEYGNWEKAERRGGLHNYPYYIDQEKRLEKHEGGSVPYLYRFSPKDIDRDESFIEDENLEILSGMESVRNLVKKVWSDNGCTELLEKFQMLAIRMGERIEKEYGEAGAELVEQLEQLCEEIFELNEKIIDGNRDDIGEKLAGLRYRLDVIRNIYDRIKGRESIFIISRFSEWKEIEKFCKNYIRENSNTYLMPVPYYKKDWYGSYYDEKSEYYEIEPDAEKSGIRVLNYKSYDFKKKNPKIFITDPLDGFHSAISINPFFYASNLRKYTDNLSYIDINKADLPVSGDERGSKNAGRFIISPGVIMSDFIYLKDEKWKKLYLELLSETDRTIAKEYWEEKIRIYKGLRDDSELQRNETSLKAKEKNLIFYTSASVFYVYGEKAVRKLEKVIDTFNENREQLRIYWITDRTFEDNLKRICGNMYEDYKKIKNKFIDSDIGTFFIAEEGNLPEKADAYYGSGGYFMNIFVGKGIPIMLWDVNI